MHGRREGWHTPSAVELSHTDKQPTHGKAVKLAHSEGLPIRSSSKSLPCPMTSLTAISIPPFLDPARSAMANRPSLSFSTTDPDPPLGNNYSASSQLAHKSHTLFCFATHFLFSPFFSLIFHFHFQSPASVLLASRWWDVLPFFLSLSFTCA